MVAGTPPFRSPAKASRLTVVKVGGSLLGGEGDLRRVASALVERRREGGALLVVASALKGVTDLLDQAAREAVDRQRGGGHPGGALERLRLRHAEMARGVADGAVPDRVQKALEEVARLIDSIHANGKLSDAACARLLSYGERLSVILLSAAIAEAGHESRSVTAEEAGLRAQGDPRAGSCDLAASAPGFRHLRHQLNGKVLVLTGFYGVGGDGGTVLFGRGGSDDTACAVAAGLGADRLELWKDVPGLMSADPQEVRGAQVVREVSFDELAQLGAYGARIVHHGCLEPLRGLSTQVSLSSIPGAGGSSGTRLVERPRRGEARVVALASRRGSNGSPALIGVVGDGVAEDAGIRSRVLSRLEAAGARGDLGDLAAQPSGRSGLSCTVHPDDLLRSLSTLHDEFFASPERSEP